MVFRDLIEDLKGGEKEKFEYFLSIVIGKTWLTCGIWRIVHDVAQIVARGAVSPWQEQTSELIKAADDSFSSAIGELPEGSEEPTMVVFGLPPSWVDDSKIKVEELERLKILSEKLEIKPAGFVVIPEAIAHWLKSQEGSPPNAILVGLGEEEIDVTLIRTGKVLGTTTVSRSVSLADDIAEGLTRFKKTETEPFPSRILIYNHKEAELSEAKQALLSWDFEGFPFLHTPKIESLVPDITISAVSFAGATEMGKATTIEKVVKPEEEKEEEIMEDMREEKEGMLAEGMEEEREEEQGVQEAQLEKPEEVATSSAEDLGFSEGDVKEIPQKTQMEQVSEPEEVYLPEYLPKKRLPKILEFFPSILALPHQLLKGVLGSLGRRGILATSLSLMLFIFLAGVLAYWRLPRAEVVIFVAPQKIEKELNLTVDPTLEAINVGGREIPGKIVDSTVSGEKTRQTTGTRTVGERAKGTVTIRNQTADPVTLPAGTILTEPTSGLKFTLDEPRTATAAGGILSPGTVDGNVTAADIGVEYNLAKDTKFRVVAYSLINEVDAISKANFSGGTSREVATVSEEDMSFLEESLKNELVDKAKEEISVNLSPEEILIDKSTKTQSDLRNFSHDEGDETETLKLSLRISVLMLSVSKRDISGLVAEEVKDDVPQGFSFKEGQIESRFELLGEEEGKFTIRVFAIANLLPSINPDELAKNIVGRYPSEARDYLSSIAGYTRSEITLKPRLPGRLGTLPRIPQNIRIEVTSQR